MASVLDLIKHYQHNIEKYSHDKHKVLKSIDKLYHLGVTVEHLQETGVGRTVNALRKEPGDIGNAARALVNKWKIMVADEEKSDPEDHPQPTNYNGHSSGKDSDENVHQSRNGDRASSSGQHYEHRHLNGDSGRKRKYSSEQDQQDSKRSKPSSSHTKHKSESNSSESDSQDDSSDSQSDSSSSSSDEKSKQQFKKEQTESYSTKSHRQDVKKESKESSKHNHKSEKHTKEPNKEHERSSSSHKHKSHEKENSSKHKTEHRDKSSSKSSEKHADKKESKSEHKSHSDKEKKHSSHSKNETDKHKSSSEVKDRHTKSSSKHKHSSTEKSHSSSSKDRSDSHKKDRKESTSESKPRSSDKSKTERSDREKDHKKSSSSSHKSSKSTKSKDDLPKKKKSRTASEGTEDGIDCGSGASFAEALGMVTPSKSKKKTGSSSKDMTSPSSDLSPASLLAPTAKLAPLPALEISALPEISPHYKPRPPPKLLPHFSEEDALNAGISSKNQRTKVYSGNKTIGKVTTLYEMCVQVLQEHIDALEYTGGVPYDILKPVIDKATPHQLFMLEHYNAYLMDDTDHLWQKFCEKSFRSQKRKEMETWREMYLRCQDEQEHRLKSLTANIRIAQEAKKAPIKQTKMAYVDSVVKPPRSIARKQAIHGTARAAAASPAARVASLNAPNVVRAGTVRPPPAAQMSTSSFKPKKAPLMAKALQFLRGRKR